jgi:hypothetical protein
MSGILSVLVLPPPAFHSAEPELTATLASNYHPPRDGMKQN